MKTIKKQFPSEFTTYFGSRGLDVDKSGHVTIKKGDQILSGNAALQELHDNPETWASSCKPLATTKLKWPKSKPLTIATTCLVAISP